MSYIYAIQCSLGPTSGCDILLVVGIASLGSCCSALAPREKIDMIFCSSETVPAAFLCEF